MPSWSADRSLNDLGFKTVAGLDEVGLGALAGPIVIAGVVIVEFIPEVTDSKKLSPTKRTRLAREIISLAQKIEILEIPVGAIDQLGVSAALKDGYRKITEQLTADLYLTDRIKLEKPYLSSTKGDQIWFPVSCASIVAKVYRDDLMKLLDTDYPSYSWGNNCGYGTAQHFQAIEKHGLSPHHRRSFRLN